jgi:hypothetical protein
VVEIEPRYEVRSMREMMEGGGVKYEVKRIRNGK